MEDHNHCFEKCINTQNNNTTPKEFVTTKEKISIDSYGHTSYCDERCWQPDCLEEVFRVLSASYVTYKATKTSFEFSEMRPVLSLQYAPSRTWLQYIVNVAGLVNTLLGIAACDILDIWNPVAALHVVEAYLSKLPHRRIIRRSLSSFLLLLSMLGCLRQIVQATINYLNYDTSSELYFGKTTNIEVPVYTICFPIMSLLKSMYRNTTYSELKNYDFCHITSMTYQIEEMFVKTAILFNNQNIEFGGGKKDHYSLC